LRQKKIRKGTKQYDSIKRRDGWKLGRKSE